MIRLDDIHLAFDDNVVLDGVSLTVPKGETVVILGASGSGKSTILRVLLGLLEPDRGDAYIEGVAMNRLKPRQRVELRKKMGMVFQEGALFDSLTVRDNVGYRLIEAGAPAAEVDRAVAEKLAFVDLVGTMNKMPGELSGGMKRRVALARALVGSPAVMLFDEPTTGLDPIVAKKITDHINDLKHRGITSVVVTHELPYAYRVADRIFMLREGKMVFEGTVSEFKRATDGYLIEFREYL
jgi:phospholipid/cholesterol/gamma-HCH transport system ATP-binding protein